MDTENASKLDSKTAAKTKVERSRIKISSKRQITIPSKYYEALGFDKEIECIKTNGMLILVPVRMDNPYFAEEILKDLISQGYSGDKLTAEFKKLCRKVRPAVEKIIAESTAYYYSYEAEDIF